MNEGRRSGRFPGTDMDTPREFAPVDEWCRPWVDEPLRPGMELVVRIMLIGLVAFGLPMLTVCTALGMTW